MWRPDLKDRACLPVNAVSALLTVDHLKSSREKSEDRAETMKKEQVERHGSGDT